MSRDQMLPAWYLRFRNPTTMQSLNARCYWLSIGLDTQAAARERVLCETAFVIMASRQAHSTLSYLLQHVAGKAVELQITRKVVEFLNSIRSSQDVTATAISCLRAALGVFTQQQSIPWQNFYVQERLCDCFHFGQAYPDGIAYRAELLRDQGALYGPLARNVVWTLINVADNHVRLGNMETGEEMYSLALARAEHLPEPGRAKVRFKALIGLAQTQQARFDIVRQNHADIAQELPTVHLQNAYRYTDDALFEALTWMDPTGRRVLLALEQLTEIRKTLIDIGHQPLSAYLLDDLDFASHAGSGDSSEISNEDDGEIDALAASPS